MSWSSSTPFPPSPNCTVLSADSSSSSTIFSLPDLDFELATWCMVSLIVFTILFESLLHRMERQLLAHTHYLKILSKVYKELMILGFISFSILIILQVFSLSTATTETLEFVHVWFFFIAVLYAIHVLVYMWLARRDKRRYDVATHRRIPDLLEQFRVTQIAAQRIQEDRSLCAAVPRNIQWLASASLISSVFSSIYQSKVTQLYQQMQFHIVRSLFIRTYNLPSDFDFAKYLRRCMSKHITEQLDIKETSWLMLVLFLFINVIRVEVEAYYGNNDYEVVTLWLFLVVPYFLLALSFLAVIGIEGAKRALMVKVGVERVEDLEQALLRSRAKTNNSSTATTVTAGRRGAKRASVAMMDQQEALDAYLPLLLKDLFPYNKPTLFPKLLEFIMLTQCFFIGLACIFHIRQAFVSFSTPIAAIYILFTMLPHLTVLMVVAPHVMTTYVFVHSVGYVNKEVLQHVTDFMQETEELKSEIKVYLQTYLHQSSLTLPDLFLRLSHGHSTIPTLGLRSALHDVGIELTGSQTSRLSRMMNLGQDGRIDLREFSLFLLGSEGSAGLSLVPIKESTKGQLAMISERERDGIMDGEIRRRKEQQEAGLPAVVIDVAHSGEGGAVVVVGPPVGEQFQPNALCEEAAEAGHGGAGSGVTSATPTSPGSAHSPAVGSPHSLPALDLRRQHSKAHLLDQNVFIPHTLDHAAPHHGHGHHHGHHGHGHAKVHKVAVGRADVDALDFAACFHGAETVCQRCGCPVLVKRINEHVAECRIRANVGATVHTDMAAELNRLRGGSMPYAPVDAAAHPATPSKGSTAAAAVAVDDIVLNDSRGGSKRGTRTSGRGLPLVLRADGKVELFAVAEDAEAGGDKQARTAKKRETLRKKDKAGEKAEDGDRRSVGASARRRSSLGGM